MQAVILAGGKGTRLKPYTTVIPKPLMPLGDLPIIEIILRQLKAAGIEEIILALGYLPHLFEAVIGHGDRFGLRIAYAQEPGELGTAGPLANLLDRLDDHFLVMNGDLLTTVRYDRVLAAHRAAACGGQHLHVPPRSEDRLRRHRVRATAISRATSRSRRTAIR